MWQLSTGSHGYGQAYWPKLVKGGVTLAHRLAWRAWKGKIPRGKFVLHRCDNRRCLDWRHLFLGTDQDNCDDKIAKGRGGYGPAHRQAISDALQRNGRAHLTPATVRKIRKATGTNVAIATQFGTSSSAVSHVRNRRSYKWVE